MKQTFTKLISLLLTVAFLVSAMTVFASAQGETVSDESKTAITNIFNRGFDDGWDHTNGFTFNGHTTNTVGLGEEDRLFGVNRYLSFVSKGNGGSSCYAQLSPPAHAFENTNESILEFDIRSDKYTKSKIVSFLYARLLNATGSDLTILRKNADGGLDFEWGKTKVNITPKMPSDWMHITLVFVADPEAQTIKLTCYADDVYIGEGLVSKENELFPQFFRFQLCSSGGCAEGDNVSFDNIKYYSGTSEPTELDDEDYGLMTNTSLQKTVPISNNNNDLAKEEYIKSAYIMKLGVNRALKAGERINIFDTERAGEYGAPVMIDGEIYLPLEPILQHMGFYYKVIGTTVGVSVPIKDSESGAVTMATLSLQLGERDAMLGGSVIRLRGPVGSVKTGLTLEDDSEISYLAIAMDDVEALFPGWYITYDSMGFIMLAEGDELLNRDEHLDRMTELLKKFVPDNPTAQQLLDDLSEASENFDHPYLLADDDDLDFLRSVYNREYLLSDGKTTNQSFLEECGLSREELDTLYSMIVDNVNYGMQQYVKYIVPREHSIRGSLGRVPSNPTLFDSKGNFIYPYTQDMKGAGKTVFAVNYMKSTETGAQYDHVVDEYVIAEENQYFKPKKNYVYNAKSDTYELVGEGEGIFDYVYDDYIILKKPEKNYIVDAQNGVATSVTTGTGTHDLVGTDASGNSVYAVLVTPKCDYVRVTSEFSSLDKNGASEETLYNVVFPSINYFTFGTDPSDPETYLECLSTVCVSCEEDHFGYDPSGQRADGSGTGAANAIYLAIAYHMTGELSFARLAYDLLDIAGGWIHWGPAHALNMATAAGQYAFALDLIYDAVVQMSEAGETNYKGEPMDVNVLEQHLWDKAVGEDYVMSILVNKTKYLRDDVDTPGWAATMYGFYADNTNNWGNVCNANLAIAALCLLSYDGMHTADKPFAKLYPNVPTGTSYRELALKVLENEFFCLGYFASEPYKWNGAYPESPSYWAYGTNNLMGLMTALYNLLGDDYGILDCPGYDKTFLYAAFMETEVTDGGFASFAYNDCPENYSVETNYFFTAALMLDQPMLSAIRYQHIKAGKSKSLADMFMFRDAMSAARSAEVDMTLDYCEPTLGLFTTRSEWAPGALFAGINGGAGITGHGHSDGGSWCYYNEGVMWIKDLGRESYNVNADADYPSSNEASDWNPNTETVKLHNRFRYYRLSTEGHNTFMITGRANTLPYGQRVSYNAFAGMIPINDDGELYYSDENSSYTVLDMTEFYVGANGDEYAKTAKRGMLLMNGRKTTVIQDEVVLNSREYVAWCAHFYMSGTYNGVSGFEISKDGKTIYLTSNSKVCRMTIVSDTNSDLYKFEVRRTDPKKGATKGVYLLDSTFPVNSHEELGGAPQNDRSQWRNIVITPKNNNGTLASVSSMNMAVVIDVFDDETVAKSAPVSYVYTPMAEWKNGEYSGEVDLETVTELRRPASDADIGNVIIPAATEIELMTSIYNYKICQISNVYRTLTDVVWSVKGLGGEQILGDVIGESLDVLTAAVESYGRYVSTINEYMDTAMTIAERC